MTTNQNRTRPLRSTFTWAWRTVLALMVTSLFAPVALARPTPASTSAVRGDRITVTLVSDRQDNGPTSWFDALDRPRHQDRTILPEPSPARLWTSTLVYTAQAPRLRLAVDFTTSGSFARCVVTVNDEVRAEQTSLTKGGRVTCAP